MYDPAFFRAIRRSPDDAALAFFSDGNVRAIRTQMRYEVHRCTGVVVGDQSVEALRSVMESVYEEHSRTQSACTAAPRFGSGSGQLPGMFSGPGVRPGVFPQTECVSAPATSVAALNANVISRVVPDVVSGVRSHRRYLDDISQPNPLPLERPAYVSNSGTNQLTLFRH